MKNASTRTGAGSLSLARLAQGAIVWGAGYTVFRDVLQFGTMLVLVRLVAPAEYGRFALAQTILGVLSIAAFRTFVPHALQQRNPESVDWQMHFTAAAAINCALFVLSLGVAWLLSLTKDYAEAAFPLAVMAVVFLIEIPATLRHTMVQVQHDWARFRTLTAAGAALGSVAGIVIALSGGGIWALLAPVVLFGVPATVDLFLVIKWRPDWSWSWARYRDVARFGVTRMGSAALGSSRPAIEQMRLANAFDFATLGIFTRAVGLATLLAGRVGAVSLQALHPVITRAESNSARFKRIAALVLQAVTWITIPFATLLMVTPADLVQLLYGPQWSGVVELLPLASAYVALGGISAAAYGLLLANNGVRACLIVDVFGAIGGVTLALVLIPHGLDIYLASLAVFGAVTVVLTLAMLHGSGGIEWRCLGTVLVPPLIASAAGAALVESCRAWSTPLPFYIRLGIDASVFLVSFAVCIRVVFKAPLTELLRVAPGGRRAARALRVSL